MATIAIEAKTEPKSFSMKSAVKRQKNRVKKPSTKKSKARNFKTITTKEIIRKAFKMVG